MLVVDLSLVQRLTWSDSQPPITLAPGYPISSVVGYTSTTINKVKSLEIDLSGCVVYDDGLAKTVITVMENRDLRSYSTHKTGLA